MFGTNVLRSQKEEFGNGQTLRVQSIFSTIQGEGPFAGRPAIFLRLSGCNLACYFCDTDFETRRRDYTLSELTSEIIELAGSSKVRRTNLVVITGGEPLIQNILPLCQELCIVYRFEVQIETAGTVWVEDLERLINIGRLTIVCSPKAGKVHEKIALYCYDWKYLIQEGCVSSADGLPEKSTQIEGRDLLIYRHPGRAQDQVWLQPCEVYKTNRKVLVKAGLAGSESRTVLASALDSDPEMFDQATTSRERDEEATKANIHLCARLAMKYNYRVSLQLHKLLGLP